MGEVQPDANPADGAIQIEDGVFDVRSEAAARVGHAEVVAVRSERRARESDGARARVPDGVLHQIDQHLSNDRACDRGGVGRVDSAAASVALWW